MNSISASPSRIIRHLKHYSTSAESQKIQAAVKYCQDTVRLRDNEGYQCTAFFPKEKRNAQYAIRAFNVEMASIRDNVSKPEIGKMRLEFWKDTLNKVYKGTPPQQPIAIALTEALKTSSLSSIWFKRIISERISNMDDHQFMTMKDMENYAENTHSCILYLQLESLGIKDVNTDHVVSHLGKVNGITTFLRSIPFHISQNRLVLPAEITAKHHISQENVLRGDTTGMEDAVYDVATAAYDQLLTARSLLKSVPSAAMPVLLSAVSNARYLENLEKANFNVFDRSLQKKDWKLPLVLWKSYKTGVI